MAMITLPSRKKISVLHGVAVVECNNTIVGLLKIIPTLVKGIKLFQYTWQDGRKTYMLGIITCVKFKKNKETDDCL